MIYIAEALLNTFTKEEKEMYTKLISSLTNRMKYQGGFDPSSTVAIETSKGRVRSTRFFDAIPNNLINTNIIQTLIDDYKRLEELKDASGELTKLKSALQTIKTNLGGI